MYGALREPTSGFLDKCLVAIFLLEGGGPQHDAEEVIESQQFALFQ